MSVVVQSAATENKSLLIFSKCFILAGFVHFLSTLDSNCIFLFYNFKDIYVQLQQQDVTAFVPVNIVRAVMSLSVVLNPLCFVSLRAFSASR